jgi:hypothetical protein
VGVDSGLRGLGEVEEGVRGYQARKLSDATGNGIKEANKLRAK